MTDDMKQYSDFKSFSKDQAYWERNQLVKALSKVFKSWMELHPLEDTEWDKDWRHIVFIEVPTEEIEQKYIQGGFRVKNKSQLSWHIHDSDVDDFEHLELKKGNSWDGHTTEEKYRRLSCLKK